MRISTRLNIELEVVDRIASTAQLDPYTERLSGPGGAQLARDALIKDMAEGVAQKMLNGGPFATTWSWGIGPSGPEYKGTTVWVEAIIWRFPDEVQADVPL